MNFKTFLESETYDLKANFDKFNKELFDNKLPDIPLKWKNTKRSAGDFRFQVKKNTNIFLNAIEISISRNLISSNDEISGILVHEMVHAYLAIVEDKVWRTEAEAHGSEFMAMINKLNKLVDFEIPRTENITHKKVSKHIQDKKLGAVLLKKSDGSYSFSLYTLNFINKKFMTIVQIYKSYLQNTSLYTDISIGVIKTNLYAKYKVQRSITNMKSWKVKDDELEHLKAAFDEAPGITNLDKDDV